MANKNTLLGGTDWLATDDINAADLNDTFDVAIEHIQSLSTFWLNSFLYTVYEDWDSYSTGSFTSNTKWDVTITDESGGAPAGTCEVSNTQLSGGSTNEIYLYSPAKNYGGGVDYIQTVQLTSLLIPSNSHIWFRTYYFMRGSSADPPQNMDCKIYIGNSTDGFTEAFDSAIWADLTEVNVDWINNMDIHVVAKGSNNYDFYINGKKTLTDESLPNGCQIRFSTNFKADAGTGVKLYMDDVRYSTSSIS